MLDPRITALVWIRRASGNNYEPGWTIERVRAAYADLNERFGMPPVRDVVTTVEQFQTRDGALVSAHVHRPSRNPARAALLYFHGGGFVAGDAACYDHVTRAFAHDGELLVISVDYRRGPEHKFPTAFDDAFDALSWLQDHAHELGVDPVRLAVGGDSSGATIAAVLSAYAIERGLVRPAYQLLIYPPLDATERFPSRRQFTKGVIFTPEQRSWWARNFQRSAQDRTHPYLTQVENRHPEALPPTYFLAAGYDALVDEGRFYADRLRAAGVPVTYDMRSTLAHGFVSFPRIVPEARRALRDAIRATSEALRSA
jgi:acetyl esterase